MQQIAYWLEKLGMSEYAQRFAENGIDVSVLRYLTDQDLEKIGVLLGHRRKMLAAIAELVAAVQAPPQPALTESKPQDTAERRQVTVMFSDLVGSTALSARMDPEDLREIISAYQKCVAETVQRFGGFVAKYMGDGVLVYFGYPKAHEDDAERAVRAGLALIEAVEKLSSVKSLQVRIGVGTGVVVVGDLVGSGEAQERGVVGETPNLAARLQAEATPGTIAIDTTTRRLLGGLFEYRDLGGIEAKGFANRVQAYEVVRASMVESRFEALRTATTPLVGRDEEVDLLLRRWEQTKRGDGCVVLISGEPGIGKSRIAQTIVERLGSEPHTRLRYFCSPHYQDSALYPSIAQLERAAGFRREDTVEQRLAKLEAVLPQGTNDLSDAVPLLADLLSIPTGDRYPPLNLTPQKRKEKTLHAQLAQLQGLAARQPVLMVWEDVHWSDPTTRESLDLIIDRVPRLRVLMILTFRPEFAAPWIGRPQVTMLTLNRLPRRQGAEIVAYVTGGKALPEEVAEQIIERTDGVPLFIEELTKTVVESGILSEAGDHYALAGPMAPPAIPASLHASLLARLDRLAPTREVAQIGAALGRSFSYELISAVAGMPQQKLDAALEQLASAQLIFQRGVPPDAEYTFKHALVQDAAYSTLLRSRRQELHSRIAAALEDQFAELIVAHPQLVAQHCMEAGLNEKAVSYWLKAGQQALGRSAVTEAVSQLQKGLDLLPSLPDGDWRRQRELDLLLVLRPALMATKGYSAPDVGETIVRARALAEQLGRSDDVIPLLHAQWAYHLIRGELRLALSLAEQMEQIGQAQNDVAALFLGRSKNGTTRYFLGQLVAARTLLEQAQDLSDPSHRAVYTVLTGTDQHVLLPVFLAQTLKLLGFLDQARARMNEALSEARRLGHAHTLAQVLNAASGVSSPREAQPYAEEAVALSIEHGFPYWLALGNANRGWALTVLGQTKEGVALMTSGLSMLRVTGNVLPTPWILTTLAEAYGRLGQPVEGLDCLTEAAQIIESRNQRIGEADVYRVRGDLMNVADDRAGAEQSYRQALTIAQQQSAKLVELRAATGLARLWRDQGKRREAHELLAPVYGWFTEGFDTRDLKDAKTLLDWTSWRRKGCRAVSMGSGQSCFCNQMRSASCVMCVLAAN
jgi:class 3 adenylate cyclase/tetratricopeptide (TPR) repeat protein